MNINSDAKVVLCYGDSNTWGQNDDKNMAGRYPANTRWTGILQERLGDSYYIIEEGLGGRTTDLEHYNPAKPSRNGLTYFEPCLTSHSPLDLVIVMLGTNDLKMQYSRPVVETVDALEKYISLIKDNQPKARVLLVSPIYVDSDAPLFEQYYQGTYDDNSMKKSKEVAKQVKQLAEDRDCLFFDASTVAKAGKDGIHFDEASHRNLGLSLSELVSSSL